MSKYRYTIFTLTVIFMLSQSVIAQLQVTSAVGQTPDNLVQNILIGQGVTVTNVKFNNSAGNISVGAIGEFQNGNNTNIGLPGGIILTSGSAAIAVGPNSSTSSGQDNNLPGDPQLQSLISSSNLTQDASVLEFDFIPEADTVEFRYVFGSEEYPEFVNMGYNDVFGFFVSGIDPLTWIPFSNKNIALIPSPPAPANTPVSIDNVNDYTYPQYYVSNLNGATIEYDGFTTVLTARVHVIPCLTYHIKIAVSDAGDGIYDSGVFLEENSFSSGGLTVTQQFSGPGSSFSNGQAIEGCVDAKVVFKFPAPLQDPYILNLASIGGTAVNGTDFTLIPTTIVFAAGSDSGVIVIQPIADGITEGTEYVQLVVPTGICSNITGDYDTIYIDILEYQPLSVNTINDTSISCGDDINLVAQQVGGYPPYDFHWTNGATSLGYVDSVNIALLNSGTFTIELSDACDNTIYDSVEVTVDGIVVDAGPDTSICIGDSITLTATGASTYQWSNGGATSSITVSPGVTTTYHVTGTQACTGEDSITITVHPLPVVDIQASQDSVCPGESTTLDATGADTWNWTSNPVDVTLSGQNNEDTVTVFPDQTTVYTLTGTDQYGCENVNTYTIVAKAGPTSDFDILDTAICVGEPTTIVYSGSSSTNAQFYWEFNNGHANGSGSGPYQVEWDTAGRKTVSLTIIDLQCPSNETIKNLGVQPEPEVGFTAANTEGCPPLNVFFTDTSSKVSPNANYQWSFGNGGSSSLKNPDFNYTVPGWYDVSLTVTNSNGCQEKVIYQDLVHVYPVPEAGFAHTPEFGTEFDPLIKFYDQSIGSIVSWSYTTGDGASYVEPNFHHQYADTGAYEVELIVINTDGCTDTVKYDVVIRPDYTFYIPNAFTPDGDFINDEFKVLGLNNQAFFMSIYDRWGKAVFESKDINLGWDGNINGSPAPVGSYIVVVYYTDVNGLRRSYYGHVALVR